MNKISIRFFLFTLVLVVVANLHAASTKIEIGNELDALLGENCSEQDEKKLLDSICLFWMIILL